MNVVQYLPTENNDNLKNINDGDYQKDGLWYCGVCHKPKQHRIELESFRRTVWCICDCEQKKLDQKKKLDEYREQMRYIERLRSASMMPGKFQSATFRDYQKRKENERPLKIAMDYVERFREMESKVQGLVFYGPVGTGKSFTAACIANALMEKSVPVIMTSFVKILQDIQGQDEARYVDTLNAAKLLIIDDLGAERNTDYALEKVYNIIDSRVRANKPMILTTNLKMQDMMQCSDIRYRRIYDRIFENCYPVEMSGTSFRMARAAQRQEQMKKMFD